jgi:hypothetical protein
VVTYPRGGATEGTQSSAGSVANGLVPTGKQGSELPILEPVKSGTAQPATSPVNARHTVESAAADTDPPGYSPAQIQQYLGLTGDAKEQTIAIVDAYDDPDITPDAETFSQQYGLPGVCGAGGASGDCFHLNVEEQSATAGSNGNWALEESMDVEWAHSIAPDATIDVEEAAGGDFAALFAGVATATAKHPAAVSMSWGISEEFSEETYYDHFCRESATVCVVSSGDLGYPGSYPAYNPSVLSIGGTTLTLGSDGSVTSELDWSQSGGGQSWVEREPSYQDGAEQSGFRDLPDVSYDADPNTGVAVYDSVPFDGQSGWWVVGGTSLGAPSWSAILADADQLRAGAGKAPLTASDDAVQRDVYSLPSTVIAAVTSGPDNGSCPVGCAPTRRVRHDHGAGQPAGGHRRRAGEPVRREPDGPSRAASAGRAVRLWGCLPGRWLWVLDSGTAGCARIARAARGNLEVPARRWAVVAIVQVDVWRRGDHRAGPVAPLPVGYLALVRNEGQLDGVGGRGPAAFREFRLGTAGVVSTGWGDLDCQREPSLRGTRDDEIYSHRAGVRGALRSEVPRRGERLAHGAPGRAARDACRRDDRVLQVVEWRRADRPGVGRGRRRPDRPPLRDNRVLEGSAFD